MWTKRILILLPVVVGVFLLQSYFWVPTYEEQARATPERLGHHIRGSIGDAQILNTILNADVPSSQICGLVFDGLIDRDRDLGWRGRLATSWQIFEEAYFVVNPSDGRSPEQIAQLLRTEKAERAGGTDTLAVCLANIAATEVLPPETVTKRVKGADAAGSRAPETASVSVTVKRPARIKLTLRSVDQDLFKTLTGLLGADIFSSFKGAEHISVVPEQSAADKAKYAERFLPATEHNPIIVFHLRKGVRFHDGHEFDSGDVKFTYEALMDERNASPRISDYEPVRVVETPDKYTVRVVYKRLFSPAFGSWGIGMLPEHLLNDERLREEAGRAGKDPARFTMREGGLSRKPIGTGPFTFVRWESDQFIKLARNDDYWEGRPEYKEYTFRVIPDMLTQEMEFYAGAVDGYGAQPHQVARLKKDPRYQNFSGLSFGYTYIGYNMRRDLFKDKRVRRALGMAIDMDRIIKYVLYDQAERITGPFVKQTDFYDHGIRPVPYDPKGALKLLNEAGWKKNADGILEKNGRPFKFKLLTNNGNPTRKAVMTVAQDSWKKLGIDVETQLLEWAVFIEKYVDQGQFDAVVLGWSMGIDPDLYQIWHSSQSKPYMLNFVAFKNAAADDLIIRVRQEYDHDKQVEMCHELHRIIADEQPYTFLFVGKWTALLSKTIFVVRRDDRGDVIGYEKIKPTKTGNYTFDFNDWLKLPDMPQLKPE